jgi:hypothetical protein
MGFKDIDLDSILRRIAEKRIGDAMLEGKFDNLPGMGDPVALDPLPADENARAAWWAIRLLRINDFTPHEVQWRKRIDALKESLAKVKDEAKLIELVRQINTLVKKINTLGTNAINVPVAGVSLEAELARLRQRS